MAGQVGLRERAAVEEGTRNASLRMRESLYLYTESAAASQRRTKTEVIEGALEIDRAMHVAAGRHRTALRAFARAEGLDLGRDLHEVLARLVVAGLRCSK